ASKENLKVVEKGRASASVMELEASELPRDYAALVHNPVIKAYKFYKSPHWVDAELAKFQRVKLVGTLVDYARLNTRVALNGELVTKVECRLKNASRQFLKMKLPEGSELWNVSVDGARKRVSESSGAKGVYLVPIPRKKDTDEPVALSISYARKLSAELGSGTSFHLVAPEFDIDSLSLRWKITVPDNYDFTSIESNMMTRGKPRLSGFSGMYSNMLAWWQNWTRSASLVGFFIMFCGGSLLAYAWGRGKLRILLSVVSCVAMLFGCVMIAGSLFRGGIHAPADAAVNSVVFTKLFATTANAPEMRVAIEDMEASSFMKFFWFFVLIVPALWLLRSGLKRKSPFFFALSVVLASAALSRWLPASHLLGLSFAIFIPAGLFTALITGVFKKSKAARIAATMALALSFPLFFASANAAEPAEAAVVVDSVDYEITATASEVRAVASFAVTAESPGDALIVPAPVGITGDLPDDDDIRIERKGGDYYVKMLSTGKTEFKLTLLLPLKKEMD
ncbi:MAG: hypothetical protein KAG97_07645, partial [Victivallales bacterium]|nr:hypothetical protein [Victivallales bacterium]